MVCTHTTVFNYSIATHKFLGYHKCKSIGTLKASVLHQDSASEDYKFVLLLTYAKQKYVIPTNVLS